MLRDRAERFAFLGLLDVANGQSYVIMGVLHQYGPMEALLNLGGISVVLLFAIFVIAKIGLGDAGPEPDAQRHRRGDGVVLAGVALAAFLPIRLASAMGVFLAGVYLSMTGVSSGRSGMSRSSRLGMMFLALSGTLLWGKMLIRLVPMTILRIDAKLAGTIAGVAVNGNLMSNHGAAGGVVIYPGCSSVHNMSLAVILWAALLCNFAIRPNRKLVAFGALAVFSMGLINVIRLSSLVYFPGYFDFLHEGFGGFLFGLASLIVSGTIISYGIIHSARIPA